MIPILIENRDKALEDHWNGLSKLVLRKKLEIEAWIQRFELEDIVGPNVASNDHIRRILTCDFQTQKRIVERVGVDDSLRFLVTNYNTFIQRKSKYNGVSLVKNVGIPVCPYCNRTFVQNVKSRRTSQLDHFFPKENYPYLALSFYNLVPSCFACNHQKGNQEVSLSPYEHFSADDYFTFNYRPKDAAFRFPKGELDITFDYEDEDRVASNRDVFGLQELYSFHTDIVKELLLKADIYSPDYIKNLVEQFPELLDNEEEAIRLVSGNYPLDSDLGKRPLSKLTRDILKRIRPEWYGSLE